MTERFDAVAVRKWTNSHGEEQTAFTNIGVAFAFKDKPGYSLKLHCLPAPVEGEYTVLLFPPKPREDQQESRQQPPAPAPQGRYSADKTKRQVSAPAFSQGGFDGDDIPFRMETRG